ncbi:MAG TPA: endo-1,4-beta-xylanase [Rhizomicrobium sp.]|nr:endo-1,4-beta-xylanase [Rhizomicrobium sp.]
MEDVTRRGWMGVAAGVTAGAAIAADATVTAARAASGVDSLDALAKAKGFTGFGSCIGGGAEDFASSFNDSGVRAIHERECGIVVCENETKWVALRPNPREYTFYLADRVVEWAQSRNMLARGHTLLWQKTQYFPKWLLNYDFGPRPATEAERLLREHITTVCNHFGKRIFTYDVVNETVDESTGEVRQTPFTKYLGETAIDICFDAAHSAAPHAKLVYNDYMGWAPASARHRDGVLKLLSGLQARKVPVHLLGVQSHIGPGTNVESQGSNTFNAADQSVWKQFLDAVVAMDLRLALTEFDVGERGTPADIPGRDRFMADLARRYLDFMFAYRQTDYLMAWGMLDRYSWLQNFTARPDGMLKRPSLYDDNYQPKPIRQAIADAFRNAPARA